MSGSGPELTCFPPSGEPPGLPLGETAAGTEHRARRGARCGGEALTRDLGAFSTSTADGTEGTSLRLEIHYWIEA